MPQRVISHTKSPEIERLKKRVQKLEERKAEPETVRVDEAKKNYREWDLFICHASEDKEEIARPLATALNKAGFRIWYDEFTLTIGDSLRRSIDNGLAQSEYGLVILSPSFFEKGWPQTELDGLAARERDRKKVILPVWHKVDREYVTKFSPTLADKFAISTKKGIDFIVKEVSKVVQPRKTGARAKEVEKAPESMSKMPSFHVYIHYKQEGRDKLDYPNDVNFSHEEIEDIVRKYENGDDFLLGGFTVHSDPLHIKKFESWETPSKLDPPVDWNNMWRIAAIVTKEFTTSTPGARSGARFVGPRKTDRARSSL